MMKYKKDERIVYGNNGVCRVEEAGMMNFSWLKEPAMYYTLQPLYKNQKIYAPAEAPTPIRKAIGRSQAESLLEIIPKLRDNLAVQSYEELAETDCHRQFNTFDCMDLIKTIGILRAKEEKGRILGRNLTQEDQRLRDKAEDLLYGEMAAALDMTREDMEAEVQRSLSFPEA